MKALLILLSLLTIAIDASAQNWFKTAGPVEDDVFDLCIDSNGILYAVTPLGVNRSTNGGDHWTRPFVFPVATTTASITIASNGSVLVASSAGIFVSSDRGTTFTRRTNGPVVVGPKQFATSSSGRIFCVVSNRLLYSDSNGTVWKTSAGTGMRTADEIPYIITASHDTVLRHNEYFAYFSVNNGATWQSVVGFGEGSEVKKMFIMPNGRWVGVMRYGIFYFDVPIGLWRPLFGVPSMIFHTADVMPDGSMLVSMATGIYHVLDTAISMNISENFGRDDSGQYYRVTRFIEDPKRKVFFAATTGAGVWRYEPVSQEANDHSRQRLFRIVSNPATERLQLEYTAFVPEVVTIELLDILGRVYSLHQEYVQTVQSNILVDLSNVQAGNYLLVLRTNERTETQWVAIVE